MQHLILASRSPQRIELLQQIVPAALIEVRPPRNTEEAGFDGLETWPLIEAQLAQIARDKCDDVRAQLEEGTIPFSAVVAADTVIVGETDEGRLVVLGQPPEGEHWEQIVKEWFRDYYFGRAHTAVTAVCVATSCERYCARTVKTRVTMAADGEQLLDWYIATGEPRGKAGGYALQGAGSVFITAVDGSLSNVVGLPLRELREILDELKIDVHGCPQ